MRKRLPLRTPIAEEGNIVLSSRNTLSTAPVRNASIALAVAASAEAEIDHYQFCFCYCDAPGMDLLQMQCCKQTIHHLCLVAHLSVNSQCPYCHEPIEDIATVLELPTVNWSDILCEKMPAQQPTNPFLKMLDRSNVTRDLQSMMLDRTPLRQADTVCADSQERKCQAQLIQATKMMKMQGQDIALKGAAPGAVVTVQCDYRAVSHAVGIVGIIYEASKHGGARVATECGILSSGPRMGSWWIPSDRYVMRYASTEEANIKPELKSICNAILAGTYNINNSAPKCSIQ